MLREHMELNPRVKLGYEPYEGPFLIGGISIMV